jgi:acetylornithine/N-succinyldiaminopimelate aminotransferase
MTMTTTTVTTIDEVHAREARHILQLYRRAPVTFVRGDGVHLYDIEGREYIDLLSGIGVASLGHGHAGLARAVAEQAETLLHTSNLFYHPLQGALAERLANLSGLERAFFCNSGTEAVEACLKFARRYWYTRGERRPEIIALEESFHGRTFGSLSVTSDEHYRAPFEPLLSGVKFVPVNDPDALRSAVSTSTAAIIAEPVQGEGGIRPLTPAFARAITEACERTGSLFIADEVQSGLGRTGYPFYFAALGLKPHLVAIGKALGGGVPVGAALIGDEVATTIAFGDHGSTYGGNLLACRAALCFLDELVGGGLLAHIGRVGPHFEQRLRAIAAKHPIVADVRGRGLMWGLELTRDAAPVVPAALERGVVVNRTAQRVVRLLPPLVITEAEADEGLDRLDAALSSIEGSATLSGSQSPAGA